MTSAAIPTSAVASTSSVATSSSQAAASAGLTGADSPPSNVLEDIARSLPESSLFNTFRYDVSSEAPYPLWFLDPQGPVYKAIIQLAQLSSDGLHAFHDVTGLPWWAAIIAGGVVARLAVLPFTVYSLRNASRAVDATDDLRSVRQAYQRALQRVGQGAAVSEKLKLMMAFRRGVSAALEKANCYPLRSLAMPLIQVPIVVAAVLGARHSVLLGDASFEREGALWFQDLTVSDPQFILPMVSLGLTYAALEVIFGSGKAGKRTSGATSFLGTNVGNTVKSTFQMSLLLSSPFLVDLPAGLYLLMMTNSAWTIAYLSCIRSPVIHKLLTGREPPSTSDAGALNHEEKPASQPVAAALSQGVQVHTDASVPVSATPRPANPLSMHAALRPSPREALQEVSVVVSPGLATVQTGANGLGQTTISGSRHMHTIPVTTASDSFNQVVSANSNNLHDKVVADRPEFPQFVSLDGISGDVPFIDAVDHEVAQAFKQMNKEWPLLTGSPNAFQLRIAAGTASAPWYIPARQVQAAETKRQNVSMVHAIVSAIKQSLAGSKTSGPTQHTVAAQPTPFEQAFSGYWKHAVMIPENRMDARRQAAQGQLHYPRVYLGSIGKPAYAFVGAFEKGESVKSSHGGVETLPGMYDLTLSGKHANRMHRSGLYGFSSQNVGGSHAHHAGGAQPAPPGGSDDDGNNRRYPRLPTRASVRSNRRKASSQHTRVTTTTIAASTVIQQDSGYFASQSSDASTDHTTDSESSSTGEEEEKGAHVVSAGRTKRRHSMTKHLVSKSYHRKIMKSLLAPAASIGGLPITSARRTRSWQRIMKQHYRGSLSPPGCTLAVEPTIPQTPPQETSGQGSATASHAVEDISAALCNIAFGDVSDARDNDPAVDDDTLKVLLGPHFEAWLQQEVREGRRALVHGTAHGVQRETVPDTADVEVITRVPSAVKSSTQLRGTLLEDGTFVEEKSITRASNTKRVDLAGLLTASNAATAVANTKSVEPTEQQIAGVTEEELLRWLTPMDASQDLSELIDRAGIAHDVSGDLGFSRWLGHGMHPDASGSEDAFDEVDGPDESRIHQLRRLASSFGNPKKHLPAPTRRRARSNQYLQNSIGFARRVVAREHGGVGQLSRVGLVPASTPVSLDLEPLQDAETQAQMFLNRIAHAVSASTSSQDLEQLRKDAGVLNSDASQPVPVYEQDAVDATLDSKGKKQ
jgi:membrane protein insertase Oxa1/YidC/SpoIIIJ